MNRIADRLRITFICPPDSLAGGMRVIALYAAKLAARGHHVTAVIPRHRGPSLRDRARALVKRGVWLRGGEENGRSFFQEVPFEVRRLDHAGPITDRDVPDGDVVIATWWETGEWCWALSAARGAKMHFMQDYEVWGAPNGDVSRVDAVCALPMPKIVIAQWVWDLLGKRWDITPAALVLNSVETEKFHAPPRGKQGEPTVGFTFTTLRSKGCDIITRAIERARRDVPALRIISFGGKQPTPELPLPCGTQFHFEAPDEALPGLYASCDAWLFGTRIEGFGLPILEAMACRTPVIGTPAGAAPDLLSKGGGILVGMENVDEMAAAIVRVARMKEGEWRTHSDAAFRTATAYTWDDATDRFEAAILKVARHSASVTAGV